MRVEYLLSAVELTTYSIKWLSHLVHETKGININYCLIAFVWLEVTLRVRARVYSIIRLLHRV